jgi:hypothetical protein
VPFFPAKDLFSSCVMKYHISLCLEASNIFIGVDVKHTEDGRHYLHFVPSVFSYRIV